MRASNNRTNPRYSGDSIQRSWTSLLAERMQWTAARKSTALKTDLGTKTEVFHGESAVVGRARIERGPDLGILPTTEKQPLMEYGNEAPSWDTSVFVPKSSRIAALIAPGRVATSSPSPSPAATLRHIPFRALMRGDGRTRCKRARRARQSVWK